METKEQKIERLKEELTIVKDKIRFFWENPYGTPIDIIGSAMREKAKLEQQLKELEDDTRN